MDEAKVPDEVAYDPYKLLLYKKAIRKGKERENTLRINIIGNYAQGKTSLAKRLVGKTSDGVISTNGIEINRFKCQTSDNGNHTLAPFENENQEFVNRVATVARSIEQTIKLDRGETKDDSQQTTLRIETSQDQAQPLETKHHVPTKAVASKIDDVENFVHPESMRINIPEVKKKKTMSLSFEEMATFSNVVEVQKDKPAKFIDIWDFGGQYIFYATHSLFHSRKALYLLVFDLTKSLDKIVKDEEFPGETGDRNMEYFARFWMESIHAYTGPDPKVILVGTHKDKLQGNEQLQIEYFEKIRCLFDDTELINHIQTKDFAVDNYDNSDPEIANLLEFILKMHEEQVHPMEIPARWIQLEKALREMKRPIVSFQDMIELDKHTEYPLLDEEQLKLFLHYHHEKGTLFYYDEDKLSDFICLCPQFLIDAFKCIITSEHFYKNHPDIRSLWKTLSTEGRLEHHLIDKVWSDKPNFKKHKNAILGFLRKQNIISGIVEYTSESEEKEHTDWFIVPSLLKGHSSKEDLTCFLARKSQSQVRYSMKFCKSSVVHLTFHKVLAAALGTWPVVKCGTKRLLYENVCVFKLIRNHAGLLEQRKDSGTIELRVINLQPRPVESHPADGFRRFVESVVIHEFRRFRYHKEEKNKPFVPVYRCNHTDHGPEGGSQLTDFKEDEEIICPDNITHDSFDYKRAHEEWSTKYTDDEVYPKMKLSNKTLSLVAQRAIGTNWSLLGPQLRVKKAEIDHIEEQHKQIEMKIFSMLRKWKDRCADKATLDVLVETIKKCPGVTIYWDELRNIRDEYCRKQDSQEKDFIQPLSDKIIKVNKTLTLECEITKSNASVMWLKDGETIRQDGRTTISSDGRLHTVIVDNVTGEDAGKYKCTYGTSITECFVKIEDPHGPLKFMTKLTDIEVGDILSTVTFLCELNKSQPQVEWYCRSQRLHPSSKYSITDDGSTHMLKIEDVSENDEGTYSVFANGLRSEATLYIEDTEEEKYLLTQHRIKQRDNAKKIVVRNLPRGVSVDTLELYFESKKHHQRSMKVKNVDLDIENDEAIITFYSASDVEYILKRQKSHPCTLNKQTLVIEPLEETADDTVDAGVSQRGSQNYSDMYEYSSARCDDETDTIEVCKFSKDCSEDTLQFYFENKRRSGGGEIVSFSMQRDKGYAHITFKEMSVVKRVLEQNHVVEQCELTVVPFIISKTALLLHEVPDTVTEENISKFVEAKLNVQVDSAVFSQDRCKCLVQCSERFDFSKAKEVCKKFKVGGVHVIPSQIPVSTGVIVTNIPENITQDGVEVYFENTRRSQGGETQHVEIKAEDGYCLVFFKDANVVGRVCQKKDHKLHGRRVDVKPYNEYLGLPLGKKALHSNYQSRCH